MHLSPRVLEMGGGEERSEGTLDKVAEKQRELGKVVRGLAGQVERLVEDGREVREALGRLEARGKEGRQGRAGARYRGGRGAEDTSKL